MATTQSSGASYDRPDLTLLATREPAEESPDVPYPA